MSNGRCGQCDSELMCIPGRPAVCAACISASLKPAEQPPEVPVYGYNDGPTPGPRRPGAVVARQKPFEVPLTGPELAEKYGFKPHTKPAEYAGSPVAPVYGLQSTVSKEERMRRREQLSPTPRLPAEDEVLAPEEVWLVARTSDGGPASGYHFLNYEDANNWIRRLNLRGVTPVCYRRAR